MTMAHETLCQSLPHGQSRRTAIVSHERGSVWLYLTKPHSRDIERDCWLFNSSEAPEQLDIAQYRGEAPPAPRHVMTEAGVRDA